MEGNTSIRMKSNLSCSQISSSQTNFQAQRRRPSEKRIRPLEVLLGCVGVLYSSSSVEALTVGKTIPRRCHHRHHYHRHHNHKQHPYRPQAAKRSVSFYASIDDNDTNIDNINVGGVVLRDSFANDKASLLASAFAALEEKDQYDAVLTGLCAKILDGDAAARSSGEEGVVDGDVTVEDQVNRVATEAAMTPSQRAYAKLKDPIRLLNEMNARGVQASGRSLMALVDATAATQDPRAMATILSLSIRNRSLSFYGSLQSAITALPPTPNSPVIPGTSSVKEGITRAERLAKLPSVPTDDRGIEVTSAIAAMATVGLCLIVQGFSNAGMGGTEDIAPYTNTLLTAIVTLGIVDNFYDAIKTFGSLLVKANSDKVPDSIKKIEAPDKESMPLGLGTGQITGSVIRGLTRLWSVDTERECQCEAAAFFSAYSLGLPCFAFRPNALEAAVLTFESVKRSSGSDSEDEKEGWAEGIIDPLLSDSGIMKILIWLMAPVAMESSLHPQLISSDPREARGLLRRLKEKAGALGAEEDLSAILQLSSSGDDDVEFERETEDLLKWAYAEADLLLRDNKGTVLELTERLVGGAATIGDCVAVLENL